MNRYNPSFFLEILKTARCEILFDVGANIGFYSLISTLLPDIKKIHSFEAIDETYLEMKQNVVLNDLQDIIHMHNLAVSDTSKSISFVVADSPL